MSSYNLSLTQIGSSSITAENGLKIECKEGAGTAMAALVGTEEVSVEASVTLKGCVWVGTEKACTINDGGEGLIKVKGKGTIIMDGANYLITSSGGFQVFTTVLTEGFLCAIPEEEVVSGGAHGLIEDALTDTAPKEIKLLNLSLTLGNSSVKSLNATVSAANLAVPTIRIGIHLVNL